MTNLMQMDKMDTKYSGNIAYLCNSKQINLIIKKKNNEN